jgi:hypothetical protein
MTTAVALSIFAWLQTISPTLQLLVSPRVTSMTNLTPAFLKYRLEALGDESARVGSVRGVPPALVRLDLLPERGARCGHGRVVGLRTMCTGKRSVSR